MIAALFVMRGGPYYGLPGVDPWDVERDARTYAGPWPVVAHPPCERWGRYWSGGPSARVRRELGDDDGCFASALASVRRWGGVLEHPEASHAWAAHGLLAPPPLGFMGRCRRLARLDVLRRAGPLRAPSAQGDMALRLRGARSACAAMGTVPGQGPSRRGLPQRRGKAPRGTDRNLSTDGQERERADAGAVPRRTPSACPAGHRARDESEGGEAMSDISLASLAALCCPGHRSYDTPFRLDIDGEPWACATNGYALLAVRRDEPLRPATDEQSRAIHSLLVKVPDRETTIAALRAWAGPAPVAVVYPCPRCHGEREHVCPSCLQDTECQECDDGTLTRWDREAEEGIVGGCPFDRTLVARYLAPVPECPVSWRVADRMLLMRGDGWLCAVMGRSVQMDLSPPAFETTR